MKFHRSFPYLPIDSLQFHPHFIRLQDGVSVPRAAVSTRPPRGSWLPWQSPSSRGSAPVPVRNPPAGGHPKSATSKCCCSSESGKMDGKMDGKMEDDDDFMNESNWIFPYIFPYIFRYISPYLPMNPRVPGSQDEVNFD